MTPSNGISRAQMSKYDPLTPNAADLLDYQPFYEDRILVKWVPAPEATEWRCSCGIGPDGLEPDGDGYRCKDCPHHTVCTTEFYKRVTAPPIFVPTAPSPRDSGPQHGIVVAVGPGNSGIHGFGKGMDAEGNPKKTFHRFDFDELRNFMRGTLGTKDPERIHVPTELRPGDRILYARNPRDEFQRDGETYTFLFEEQHVLAVIDES